MKAGTDHSRRPATFEVGEKVWLSTAHLPLRDGTRKLSARWAGPYEVCAIIAPTAYRVAIPAHWRIHDVFHASQLKPSVGSPPRPEPLLVDASDDKEFEVAQILDKRVTRNSTHYLVRWLGYDAFEDTWEPEANLKNAQEKIREFE